MIDRILIANRGEIAVRIMKAAAELGIQTIAVYSDLDGPDAYHCRVADRALPLQGLEPGETYLNCGKMISLARQIKAQAIHPGYGFLSENPELAGACEKNKLIFIGPGSEVIRLMGDKIEARKSVSRLGIPVIDAITGSPEELKTRSGKLQYPLLIKAAAGGGGKGMRIVRNGEELADKLEITIRESGSYFGNGNVFLEKYINPARHIEFQVLGDHLGNAVHVFERECCVQRRYQKIIEESPSVWLKPRTREAMGQAAVKITRELGYTSAGTIEFLVDEHQNFYFLEMNTRIQVEHPVTEMVSGIDLVREQIRIAQGMPLAYRQEEVSLKGHAIEARIYAENPEKNFLPSPGRIYHYRETDDPSVRMDTSIDGPAEIHPQYDPMISKMIVRGQDRNEAIHHLYNALQNTSLLGIKTNLLYLQEILADPDFLKNNVSTLYCERRKEYLEGRMKLRREETEDLLLISGFLSATMLRQETGGKESHNPWKRIGYWRQAGDFRFRMNGGEVAIHIISIESSSIRFLIAGRECGISLLGNGNGVVRFLLNGEPRKIMHIRLPNGEEIVDYKGVQAVFKRWDSLPDEPAGNVMANGYEQNDSTVVSPMYGKIISINVKEKESVKQGDILMTIDSMKIENNILAPRDAKIGKIVVGTGEQVEVNKPLMTIE